MDRTRSGEEQIGWSKRLPRLAANKLACARDDEVDLVSRVRLLWISSARRVDLDQQTSLLEHPREALTFGTGQAFERFGNRRADAWIVRLHFGFTFVFRWASHVGGRFGFFAS